MENISKILKLGDSKEKIKILETLDNIDNPEILETIISTLDDENIEVRGEVYSSLVSNKNEISNYLINSLNSASGNIRSSILLVLANRNEISAIPEIIKLVKDERSIVRSCALGALRHLKVQEAKNIFLEALSDSNIEVRKNALQAIIDFEIIVSEKKIEGNFKEKDSEIEKMISLVKKINGPEGI
ncbi:MAG: HEAT repeat domain-containing protein [Nitrosopumilus sp.]|nr:HEAT repeat domain-containing protein [Nitrosopumilus sp.]